jgi:hypothetical protein
MLKATEYATQLRPMIDEARSHGAVTLRAIAEYLNQYGATTPRGCAWTAAPVRNARLHSLG